MSASKEIQNSGNIIHLPADVTLDTNKSLGEYLWNELIKHGNKIAQIDSETGKKETYTEFLNRTISLAQALRTKGIKPNDVVVYCCANNMDYVVVMLATIFIGARFSGFDNMADTKELIHCINLINPKIIFCDEQAEKSIEYSVNATTISCEIIGFTKSNKFITMPEFIQKYKTEEEFEVDKSRKLKDTNCILFTSGTSGLVKGAEITGYGLYYGGLLIKRAGIEFETGMIFTLPSWISNVSFTMSALINGLNRVIYKAFNKDNLVKTMYEYKANVTMLTQSMMNILMKFPECCNYDTSQVKYIMFGGSMIGGNSLKEILKIFPNAALSNCYGMTEVAGLLFTCPTGTNYFDAAGRYTVGMPTPGFYYKIVDPETKECLGPNKRGELLLKYEGNMNGYINNPEKSAEAFDEDGYFKTGDIVYYDENYLFYVVDRIKEIFKFDGRHISPSIIEDQLLQHSAVRDGAIVPVPHEKGEVPAACIVLRDGVKAKEEDFVQFISERLSEKHHLTGGVIFVDRIPRTSRGKLLRNILKEQVLKTLQK